MTRKTPKKPQSALTTSASPSTSSKNLLEKTFHSIAALKEGHPTTDSLMTVLNKMCGETGRSRIVRRTGYLVPHEDNEDKSRPPMLIYSYNVTEYLYTRDPPVIPTLARGLFVMEKRGLGHDGDGENWKIMLRGYDKFFNVNEVSWTQEPYLASNTMGPYEATLKENGCIIFVSAYQGTLMVTSKHAMNAPLASGAPGSTGGTGNMSHAAMGELWLMKHLNAKGKTRKELVEFMEEHDITAVFELVDDDFEEHILEYPPEKRGLWLHGINQNTVAFQTWESSRVKTFAETFGFKHVDVLVMETFDEVMEFTNECRKTGHYNGRPIEGFVVRCKGLDGTTTEFFKIKYEEPYLMFREWREVTKALLSGKGERFKPRYELSRRYIKWVSEKILSDPDMFKEYLQNKGIIRARNLFLIEERVEGDWQSLLEASHVTTEEYRKGIATMKDDGEVRIGGDGDGSGSVRSSPARSMPVVAPAATFPFVPFPSALPPIKPDTPGAEKLLILPVAIVGLGKTTLGNTLAKTFGVGHVQSDDSKNKNGFLTNVKNRFGKWDVIYADKCNHLSSHREDLVPMFKEKYPNGRVLALQWKVKDLPREDVIRLSAGRIEARGENHQSLTPRKTPQYHGIINRFITDFTPLTAASPSDSGIDAVVYIDLHSTLSERVKQVCDAVGWQAPEDSLIEDMEKLLISTSAASESTTDSTTAVTSFSKTRKGYYGISIPAGLLKEALNLAFENADDSLQSEWKSFVERNRLKDTFHVTLALGKLPNHAPLMNKYDEMVKEAILSDSSARGKKVTVVLDRVYWDHRVMAAPVVKMPEGIECKNKIPHVTIGTMSDEFKPLLSNELLEGVCRIDDDGEFVGKKGAKMVKFVEPLEVIGESSSHPSPWDTLPTDTKKKLLQNASLLTRYLNNILTDDEIKFHENEIWNEAFKMNWDGDLALLPADHLPSIRTGLANVTDKEMYYRFCALRPDLACLGLFEFHFDDVAVWG
ncbi:hypothetical protein HDU76_001665 [Blyttiomyces sp. JEL0837]|nr:hypothetical protein HDU76_001665 [Blyttiomyces sp. JEL0837]